MAQYQNRLEELLAKYSENTVNEAEFDELCDLIRKSENEAVIKTKLVSDLQQSPEVKLDKNQLDKILNKVLHRDAPVYVMQNRKISGFARIAAAAVIVLLLSIGGYFYFNGSSQKQLVTDVQQPLKNDVAPGGNKAVLTLADGSQIVLDSAVNGTLTQQGNAKIIKLKNGELAYNSSTEKPTEVLYNTITTPKGGQYQVVLADGSKVWLNAASSLKFPATFTGKERNVELTGEGYFEVAPLTPKGGQGKTPFIVYIASPSGNERGMKVQVIGTHFNINAYHDEATIKTTLLEGSVKVQSTVTDQSAILKPRQQAQLLITNLPTGQAGYKLQTINNVDVNEVMAWKDGFFEFEHMEIPAIMRQIERWYDVSIEYKHTGGKETFGGRISRNLSLSKLLKLLDVRFRLEGNKLTVL